MVLKEQHQIYQDAYDLRMIRRLPIIARTNLRNFGRLTKHLPKPYCGKILKLMAQTLLHTAVEVEGCVFAYYFQDEFVFVLRNDRNPDTEPWFKNSVAGIASIISSMATSSFLKNFLSMEEPPEINGEAYFQTSVFALPDLKEAYDHLVLRQHECFRMAVNNAIYYEYTDLYGQTEAQRLLDGADIDERLDALEEDCGINFEKHYPASYRKGVAAYKIPVINTETDITKYKWALDSSVPAFHEDVNFVMNILDSGHDVFRAER